MHKRDLTPLRRGGRVDRHQGKGGKAAPMYDRSAVVGATQPGAGPNQFAKATPMAQPRANPAMPGVGSGGYPGDL